MPKRYFIPTLPHLLASPDKPVIHRDLSWLQFNERVLAEARSSQNPLLERVKFLAITASNLDEFFMIRYASLDRMIRLAKTPQDKSHHLRLRNALLENVGAFAAKQAETLELLASALEAKGVLAVRDAAPDDEAFALGKTLFEQQVLPHLPPPQPFAAAKVSALENLRTAAVFDNGIWFPVPRQAPRVILSQPVLGKAPVYAFFLDDLLVSHLGAAFRIPARPGLVRLTRDGDFTVDLEGEEDPASIPDIVRSGLGGRDKGRPVRLQYAGDFGGETLTQILNALRISPRQAFPAPGTLHLHGLWTLVKQLPEELRAAPGMSHPAMEAVIPPAFRAEGLFDQIRARDILLHHPYDSFDAYVRFVRAAAEDPIVTSIQQTVYRMDPASPVIEVLKAAAKKKRVRVVVELRARFDEMNNLKLTEELKKAGAEVTFGLGKLKLHAKVAAVTRKEPDGERVYTHLSTGNYNAATARQYEDLALFTARAEVGQDAVHFFDAVCKGRMPDAFKTLVHAPAQLHRRLLALIQGEIEAAQKKRPARIAAKLNALVDPQIIEKLYEASQAGVAVDLIVRGACSLIPGVKGLSENIRVVSLVDRFLEHSRIYYFLNADRIYLSSADWMPRNFFSRLELAFPLLDSALQEAVRDTILPVYFADTVKGRELTPQGTWKKRGLAVTHSPWFKRVAPAFVNQAVRAQFFLENLAQKKAQ